MRLIVRMTLAVGALLLALGSSSASAVSCASVPSVTGGATTGVSASAATIHGSVNPNGCDTRYSVQYGATVAYGSATATERAGSARSPKAVAVRIAGLTSNTIYHFRIVATNAAGATDGPDQSFQTSSCSSRSAAPSIARANVTGLGEFGATLQASVDPNGCAISYQFEYGNTTAYGHRTPVLHIAAGSSPVLASHPIGGLRPGTKYHFRLIVYSGSGTTIGPDLTFTTKLGAVVRIGPGPAYLDKPFVAGIRLTCVQGSGGCRGAVMVFWRHRMIGRRRFFLRRGHTGVILVGLDPRGRSLFRAVQTAPVEVVAHFKYYDITRSLTLIRRF